MPSSDAQARFQALKREILPLGFVRPGSLVRRFMPCGNPVCRCMATPPQLHGPYYQWSYKIAGKTRTIRLSEEQARLCQQWVRNHKRLKRLVRQMEQLSLKETDRTLGPISRP
ncbi:MAG: DUF6788 family protein [bacterium]